MDYKNGPLFIHIDITSRCNLKCIHCRNNYEGQDGLGLDESKLFIDSCLQNFKNFKQVFIGGGEPLLRKKNLFELIDYCKKKGLKCSLNTNATLIKEEDIPFLKKLDAVQVSLDGSNSKTHDNIRQVRGSFDKAIEGIKLLIKNKIYVCVRMTLFEYNFDEVFELLDICKDMGVNSFSWFRVLPSGKGEKLLNGAVDTKIYYLIMKELTRQKTLLKNKIAIVSSEPCKIVLDSALREEIIKKHGLNAVSGCVPGYIEFFLDSCGDFYPCTMLQNCKFGNLKTDDIYDAWINSPILKQLRNRENLKGKCKSCTLKNLCGGCRATAYGLSGDLFAEDPYCPKNFMKKDGKINLRLNSPCQTY